MLEGEKGKFISIHGIDGTGKTSTASEVSKKLEDAGVPAVNYDLIKEKNKNVYAEKKKEVDAFGTLEDRLAVYLESMMYHSDKIDDLLRQGFHVVKSRYLDDVRAHFSHLGISKEKLEEIEKKFPIIQPDLKVILLLDEIERRKRIEEKGALNDQDREHKKLGSRSQFFEDYLLENAKNVKYGSILKINTGEINVELVAKKIIDHIIEIK